jgi:FMN phosphatase YigB (HAD superfamily)
MNGAIQPASILPGAMPSALDDYPGVRVLSLDCFDTLIWRDSHTPVDIFARLPRITSLQRAWGEKRARQAAGFGRNCKDVTIAEIYAQVLPKASAAERQAAIEAEIAAEARHCFAFAPTVELMRFAKARGLQVIIVSDTYFDPAQLRDLIARAAGAEVAGLIDKVFCSSTYGKPKAHGLYEEVLRKLSAKPHEILHVGDNRKADVEGVAPFGVNTLHLAQFSNSAARRLRHEAAISALLHLRPEEDATAQLPHRAALAVAEPLVTDPAEAFGLTVLGPVLHGFDRWLAAEAEALQEARGGTVHRLFLMRDGHLPKLVHEAAGGTNAHAVEISRFTATACSFRRDEDPLRYIELELGTRPESLARQLLLPEADIGSIIGGRSPSDASLLLLGEMRREPRRKATVAAARAFGNRLVAHVRALANPAPGDTLMLIDLGYNGTVQNQVGELLRTAFGVHVAGRYLLLREKDCSGLDKRGFIGLDHYDAPSLDAMCANVALLEQSCTTTIGSVIDYREDGTPIRKASDIKASQIVTRQTIQAGCLRFAAAQRAAVIRADHANEVSLWRKGAAAVLGRVQYLPFAEELAVVERFEHDVNLGTDRTVALFDSSVADRGLRQRGLFYLNGSTRMFLPAELQGHGLAPKLTLLASRRFRLPFGFTDFSDATISLPVVYAEGNAISQQHVGARPTHDGYYLATMPIGDCRFSVALQFGAEYEYVQVDSVAAVAVEDFLDDRVRDDDPQIPLAPVLDGMEQVAPHLFHCTAESSFMMVAPPDRLDDTPMMVAVVFRPIAPRRHATATRTLGVAA